MLRGDPFLWSALSIVVILQRSGIVDENLKMVIELQKLDLSIKELQESLTTIPRQIEELDRDLESSQTVLSEYRKKLETVEKSRRALERDTDGNNEKKKKLETQLYTVKSNREYTALLKEVDDLNKLNLQTEEQIISLMEEVDDLRKTLALKEAEFKEETKVFQNRKQERQNEKNQIEQQLQDYQTKRDSLVSSIDPGLLTKYNRIAKARHNAVVPIRNHVCSGCFMKVRPQVLARARQSESIVVCDNCARILYFEEP